MRNTQYRGEIGINVAIAEMRASEGAAFFLEFVRTTGKQKGSIKTCPDARYGAPARALRSERPGADNRETPRHTDKGTLPITFKGEYITPLIATIISFNGYKVIH